VNGSSGYVGIRTGEPGYPLEVMGTVKIRGPTSQDGVLSIDTVSGSGVNSGLAFAEAQEAKWAILNYGSDDSLRIYSSALSQYIFSATAAGNFGIGTASPGQRLEVNGSVNVTSGNITMNTQNSICFDDGCTARIWYNGTSLVIQG
jgi:hypothetical protein